jgi:hypothetical protein
MTLEGRCYNDTIEGTKTVGMTILTALVKVTPIFAMMFCVFTIGVCNIK